MFNVAGHSCSSPLRTRLSHSHSYCALIFPKPDELILILYLKFKSSCSDLISSLASGVVGVYVALVIYSLSVSHHFLPATLVLGAWCSNVTANALPSLVLLTFPALSSLSFGSACVAQLIKIVLEKPLSFMGSVSCWTAMIRNSPCVFCIDLLYAGVSVLLEVLVPTVCDCLSTNTTYHGFDTSALHTSLR